MKYVIIVILFFSVMLECMSEKEYMVDLRYKFITLTMKGYEQGMLVMYIAIKDHPEILTNDMLLSNVIVAFKDDMLNNLINE